MSWFDRLKGKSSEQNETQGRQRIPTVTAPPDHPALIPPPAAPKKRGKAPERYETELAAYRKTMRARVAAIAAYNRERSMSLGITSYQWVAMDVHGTCDTAKRNGGKIFLYSQPPPEGHVCEGQCGSIDWCRCMARSIVPGFS
jgi:hypothetical protein